MTPLPARTAVFPTGSPFRCTVLIVDDEPGILSLLSEQLKSEFHVLTASTAAEARAAFAKADVDVLMSDLNLPDSTGVQLLEWVRKSHRERREYSSPGQLASKMPLGRSTIPVFTD